MHHDVGTNHASSGTGGRRAEGYGLIVFASVLLLVVGVAKGDGPQLAGIVTAAVLTSMINDPGPGGATCWCASRTRPLGIPLKGDTE